MMNSLLLILLCVVEIAFLCVSVCRKADTNAWRLGRLLTNAGELVVFAVMLIAPGIDLGLRFKVLFVLLLVRLVVAFIFYLVKKNKEPKVKKLVGMFCSAMLSIVLLLCSMIPSFVFSDYEGLPTSGRYQVSYVKTILTDENRVEAFEDDGSKREVPVYFFYPEDAEANTKYPLVAFSHGAFGYYQSNTSTYMELASQGYIVLSVEHPYHSLFTEDTDGKLVTVDDDLMQGIQFINSGEATEEQIFEVSSEWMKLRCDDLNFVIDSVKSATNSNQIADNWYVDEKDKPIVNSVLSHINCDKIGVMGHSLGGAAAVSIGRVRDDIGAVVDLDGTMLGEVLYVQDGVNIINEEEYQVPLLALDNEEHHFERLKCAKEGIPYANNIVLAHAKEGYCTYIAGTGHMNYTDLPLFSPVLAGMLGTGSVDAETCIVKTNQIILQFFNHYLKDKGEFSIEEGYELSEYGN